MNKYKSILVLLLVCGGLTFLSSCRSDELDSESVFIDPKEELDPNSFSFLLDRWLYDNYLIPYNLQFLYRLQDVGSDMDYNLVPTEYSKAIDMAVLAKYLWFDVYKKVVSEKFLKKNSPRIIHLIGSAEFNPANGTIVLGVAEGGIKVTLTECNKLSIADFEFANEHFFKTMHHEFSHILHQKKTYPKDFNLISSSYYEPFSWQYRNEYNAASLGLVSQYAGAANQEDFVEVIANYIVKTDAQWNRLLDIASKGWEEVGGKIVQTTDIDGVDGRAVIEQKLTICKQWLRSAWDIDLDALRNEVQLRQANIPMDSLRNQLVNDYPIITE